MVILLFSLVFHSLGIVPANCFWVCFGLKNSVKYCHGFFSKKYRIVDGGEHFAKSSSVYLFRVDRENGWRREHGNVLLGVGNGDDSWCVW